MRYLSYVKRYILNGGVMFELGDRVVKKNGCNFTNGQKVLTVQKVYPDGDVVFFETGTWLHSSLLKLHKSNNDINMRILVTNRRGISDDIKVLNLKERCGIPETLQEDRYETRVLQVQVKGEWVDVPEVYEKGVDTIVKDTTIPKSNTHIVNGFLVPAPMSTEPDDQEKVYTPNHRDDTGITWMAWNGSSRYHMNLFKNKQIFSTKEEAIANQQAQASIDPKWEENNV